jgi:hypothetical protein
MSIDPDVNAMQEVILDVLARLEELEEMAHIHAMVPNIVEVEEKDGVLEYRED